MGINEGGPGWTEAQAVTSQAVTSLLVTSMVVLNLAGGECVEGPRLMALLHELVREKGNGGAASALGINPRTVASRMKTGRLSWRVREALEQGLQSKQARRRERNDALEGRNDALEGKLRSGLEEIRTTLVG